jgi:hypothetical protein
MAGPKEDTRGDKRRRSRFDVYSAVYDRFNDELLKCNVPQATALAQSWIDARAQFVGWLNDPRKKISRSALAEGMEQGLREIPVTLNGFPDRVRRQLTEVFLGILREEAPTLLARDNKRLAQIVKRGRLRDEGEYYLVRHRIDEIEGHPAYRDEAAVLLRLLDNFEASGRPSG